MTRRVRALPVHRDARGELLPIELDDVGFRVRRVFVVTAPAGGAERGGHEVNCRELVVLLAGRAEIRSGGERVLLDEAGAAVQLDPGESMDYDLGEGGSSILVLANQPYSPERPS